MTLKEKIGVNAYGFDVETGERLSYSEIYGREIEALGGLDRVIPCIPFSFEVIKWAIVKDGHLNNLSVREWDTAADYLFWNSLVRVGITCSSLAERVCILKEAARRWVEREELRK